MWVTSRFVGAVLAVAAAVLWLLSPFFALFVGGLDARVLHFTMTIDGWGFHSDAPQQVGSVPVNAYAMVFAAVLLFAASVVAFVGARRRSTPAGRRMTAAAVGIATAFAVGVAATVTPQVTSWMDSFRPTGAAAGSSTVNASIGLGFWFMAGGALLAVVATVLAALPAKPPEEPPTPPFGFPAPAPAADTVDPHGTGGSS